MLIQGKLLLSGCLVVNENNEVLLLFRKDHQHYETPGGKVKVEECRNPENPSLEELQTAAVRELHEEIGSDLEITPPAYFGSIEFLTPDKRLAVAHKFLTRIVSGTPRVMEKETFSKLDYLPLDRLEQYPVSPDLKLLLSKIKKTLLSH
ncbi:MAG: NUDIX hydrolase [Candidatus Nanoarchaeia archaeon]